MICLVGFLGILGIFGVIVQTTSLGDVPCNLKVLETQLPEEWSPPQITVHRGINHSEFGGNSEVRSFQNNNGLAIKKEQEEFLKQVKQQPPRPSELLETKSFPASLIACFSLTYNMKKILFRSRPRSVTDSLDGIRVLSIFWVVLGHSYFFPLQLTAQNMIAAISNNSKEFLFTLVPSAVLAVDTFFFMSAFLGAFIFMGKYKHFSLSKIFIAYFHRYYRLTPILAIILYFSTYVIFPLTTGPYREQNVVPNIENCKSYGWTVILYINNFYPSVEKFTCFSWTWYLANDMQMFLILPWVMIIYKASNLIGSFLIGLLLATNLAVTFYINYHFDLGAWSIPFAPNLYDFMKHIYMVPWVRVTPYLMGICMAIWFYNYKQVQDFKAKIDMNPHSNLKQPSLGFGFKLFTFIEQSFCATWAFFIIGIGFTFYAVFGNYDYNKNLGNAWTRTGQAFYTTFDRTIFTSGVMLILIPMFAGKLTWLTIALGNSVFAAMAKVTYSVYLLHLVFIIVFAGSQKSSPYLQHVDSIIICLGALFFAYVVGFIFTVLIDVPLQNIDKTFIFPSKKKSK